MGSPEAKRISKTILKNDGKAKNVVFGSGVNLNNQLYWYILSSTGKTYYFRSNNDYSEVKYKISKIKGLINIAKENEF